MFICFKTDTEFLLVGSSLEKAWFGSNGSELPCIHSTRITGNLLEMQIFWLSSSFTEFRVSIIELLSCPGGSGAHYNLGHGSGLVFLIIKKRVAV